MTRTRIVDAVGGWLLVIVAAALLLVAVVCDAVYRLARLARWA